MGILVAVAALREGEPTVLSVGVALDTLNRLVGSDKCEVGPVVVDRETTLHKRESG